MDLSFRLPKFFSPAVSPVVPVLIDHLFRDSKAM
jgi:hypothetical protein